MRDYQICYTKLVQVYGDKPKANIYEKGCIIDLATGKEEYISGEHAALIMKAVEVYHDSENRRNRIDEDSFIENKSPYSQKEIDFAKQSISDITNQNKMLGEKP